MHNTVLIVLVRPPHRHEIHIYLVTHLTPTSICACIPAVHLELPRSRLSIRLLPRDTRGAVSFRDDPAGLPKGLMNETTSKISDPFQELGGTTVNASTLDAGLYAITLVGSSPLE